MGSDSQVYSEDEPKVCAMEVFRDELPLHTRNEGSEWEALANGTWICPGPTVYSHVEKVESPWRYRRFVEFKKDRRLVSMIVDYICGSSLHDIMMMTTLNFILNMITLTIVFLKPHIQYLSDLR